MTGVMHAAVTAAARAARTSIEGYGGIMGETLPRRVTAVHSGSHIIEAPGITYQEDQAIAAIHRSTAAIA
jgi:hypothetical protein